jgi:hypothetical protein
MIYVIRDRTDGLNFGYVNTQSEAERICAELPNVLKWEALDSLENAQLRTDRAGIRCNMCRFGASPDS